LAGGAGIEGAVELANRAAGIVVGKFGTAVVRPDELFAQASGADMPDSDKRKRKRKSR
jgi:bifunctional ADP-heptose synthase (sugar kinase/adenylyltransferase)